jgi:hypothetical protein
MHVAMTKSPVPKIPIWKFQQSATAPKATGKTPDPTMLDIPIMAPVNVVRSLRLVNREMAMIPAGKNTTLAVAWAKSIATNNQWD